MDDFARAAMHGRDFLDNATEAAGEPLMAETDAEDRRDRMQNGVARYTKIADTVRPSGSGRDDDVVEPELAEFLPGHFVVAHDNGRFTRDRRYHVDQVEGERIVVVDDEYGHFGWGRARARGGMRGLVCQNISLRPNWIWRDVVTVLVI